MKILSTIGISMLVFVTLANLPAFIISREYWMSKINPSFGALSYTTLSGTESLTGFPALWNATLASLDTQLFDVSEWYATTSAPQITVLGVISSSTWRGTPVTVPYGGTGSTTLSSNQVLLGNGTGIMKTVNGFGTTGYILTSNGAGSAPTWQVNSGVDSTAAYNWTGAHIFKNWTASSTISFNQGGSALSYTFPTVHGASSTALMVNASGAIVEMRPDFGIIASTTLQSAVAASTTLSSIPAATDLHIVIDIPAGSTQNLITAQFNTDTGANYGYSISDVTNFANVSQSGVTDIKITQSNTSGSFGYSIILDIVNVKDRPKTILSRSTQVFAGTTAPNQSAGSHVWNNTTAQINSITIGVTGGAGQNVPAGTRISVYGSTQ